MGDKGNPHASGRIRGAAAVCAVASLACCCAANAQGAAGKGDPAVRAAPGVQVQYEEKRNSRILYKEEKGGMVTPLPPPVPINVPEPANVAALGDKPKAA